MARRILSVYKLIGDFVKRHEYSDETDFFLRLRDEVSGAEVGDYEENDFIDIIYGDYIFTVYRENGNWELSSRVALLAEDGNNASHINIDMTDAVMY